VALEHFKEVLLELEEQAVVEMLEQQEQITQAALERLILEVVAVEIHFNQQMERAAQEAQA
jgi:hypothetical protein